MIDRFLSRAQQDDLLRQVRTAWPGGVVTSLHGSSASFIAALLYGAEPTQTLVVAPTLDDAEALSLDLGTLLPDHNVLHFPALEILPYDKKSPYKGSVGQQVETLHRLQSHENGLVVTSAKALKWKVQPPEEIRDYTLQLRVGEPFDFESAIEGMGEMGYYATARVETPGDFARKGGILDVFSVSYENPVRFELVGDCIESIRFFDATTQRSLQEIETALIPPCSPLILSHENVERASTAVRETRHGEESRRQRLVEHIGERLHFDGMERYSAFYSPRALLTDFMTEGAPILWVHPQALVEEFRRLEKEIHALFDDCVRSGEPVPEPQQIYATNDELGALATRAPGLYLTDVGSSGAPLSPEMLRDPEDDDAAKTPVRTKPHVVRLDVQAASPYAGNVNELRRDLKHRLRLEQKVHIFCDNAGQAERLRELLEDLADRLDFPIGDLRAGFVLPGAGAVLLTDREIFQRYRRRSSKRKYRISQGVSAYEELAAGDFVVHVNHGIARYLGIRQIQVEGSQVDCLELFFAGGDKIYVTVDQINMVQKYVGKEGAAPSLTKLGGVSWARAKAKAQRAIETMAKELLEIAAVRRSRPGYAYTTDVHLQTELEASFVYEETPDQLTAIQEVKHDLEQATPMDRLICGDVGYGKTEVAIRAAFKVVLEGRQVAVLVPTTILAQQHLATFQERFADFPVQVDMLSRLRAPRQQRETIEKLGKGQVDILIGTHRLVSKDVQFKSLGLVVVDEEHRFGVAHKEKLKQLKQTVDVLSMTATPIPRTLNMALIGLRDMSIINTAPRDRLPVQTEVLPFDEETIHEAVLRELDRGGQIYYVHNRVESIDAMAGYLRKLVPTARIGVAHGQMDERQLEKVMVGFLGREFDLLVSTMIIESGLDIPSVNTLIVNRADRMGMAQLYQLRGRVGRSSHKAYAYFMVPQGGTTTQLAHKRLSALQEFEALGSGFKVAMRDLEIRGAGNILGQEQHGHLAAIGFELYCKLLEQAVGELQGREVVEEVSTRMDVDFDYLVPETYIPDPEEKMRVYKRIAQMSDPEEIGVLREELCDRYGPLPEPAVALLQVADLRLKAWRAEVDRIRIRGPKTELFIRAGRRMSKTEIETLVRATPAPLGFDAAKGLRILIQTEPGDRMEQVGRLLDELAALATPETRKAAL